MVVAVLVAYFAPASRGLARGRNFSDGRQWAPNPNFDDQQVPSTQIKAGHKRKPFKAVALLTSLASDFDVIADWLFYRETVNNDRNYRSTGDQSQPYLIPPWLIWVTWVVCILGSVMWLILATDGRIVAPLLRKLGFDKLSIGHMLFLSVLVEDVPQVILTFIIEDYYEERQLSNLAVVNVTVSLYDTLIKLAESYDQRYDVVETGGWCKESLWAHKDVVTSVVSLPMIGPVVASDDGPLVTIPSSRSSKTFHSGLPPQRKLPDRLENSILMENSMRLSSLPELTEPKLDRPPSSMLELALRPIAPMKHPRLRFLTASLDKTIRLWDTSANMKGHRREKCVRAFRGHLGGVTCVALLENAESTERPETIDMDQYLEEADRTTFFLSGCKKGDVKLWNLQSDCMRTYATRVSRSGVTAISSMKAGSTFVVSYEDGSARLWEVWSGVCLAVYTGHSETINCMCSMLDGSMFVTGSRDATLKLWDTAAALDSFHISNSPLGDVIDVDAIRRFTFESDHVMIEERVCAQSFVCHSSQSEVLCVACIEKSTAVVAGYANGLARLWGLDSGSCLRIFHGHGGPVTAVEVVDRVTILTGSTDTHVRVWDAVSGACLRTYSEHSDTVTALSVAHDDQTFLSASADLTVKIWVISSVPKTEPVELESFLDINDTSCSAYFRHESSFERY